MKICGDELKKEIPRVLIGAVQGRSGKTTFTLGLLKALKDRGLDVQPFKKGPDYIDPSWMTFASGEQCRNLDLFMMGKDRVRQNFIEHSLKHEISVVEGAMGLFDGIDVEGSNSSAELAYTINAPVILVVNCTRLTRSAAALINGVVNFDPRIRIGGVILNQVARKRHHNILLDSIEKYCDVPVFGMLPKSVEVEIPDRHLGLIPACEQDELKNRIELLGNLVKENVNLDQILELAHSAEPLSDEEAGPLKAKTEDKVRIGILKDRAFSFYYPENLESLEKAGAELVYINSMEDQHLPEIHGLYIGGGFPEMMAEPISKNITLKQDIKNCIENNMPVYAECGGLMYLTKNILTEDQTYPMVGAFDCDVQMKPKPQGIGYTIQKARKGNPFFAEGTTIRGHEFHNSKIINLDASADFAFKTERGKGIADKCDGLIYKNTLAGYNHLNAIATPEWAESIVVKAKDYRSKMNKK